MEKNSTMEWIDKKKYKVITWKNWMMIHWILNPGLVVNELIFGQRVPKIQLVDKTSDKPRPEKTFVPCPHCHTLHDSRTWSTQNKTAFKNWFGLYCTNCGKTIPCVMNAFSFLILLITSLLWRWFRKSLKNNWLQKQPERYRNINLAAWNNPYANNGWVYNGLIFGSIMFVLMALLFPLVTQDPITTRSLLINLMVWLIGGLLYGYIMKAYMTKKTSKTNPQ